MENGLHIAAFMRADVPSWDAEDVRAMYYESELASGCKSPWDLYNIVPVIDPNGASVFQDDPMDRTSKMVIPEIYDSLPTFSWWEIFGMINIPAPKGVTKPALLRP